MKEMFGKILKNAVQFALVGAALALVLPLVGMLTLPDVPTFADAVNAVGVNSTRPLYMGAFFGSFGAIAAATGPLIDKFFDGIHSPPPASQSLLIENTSPALNPELEQRQDKSYVQALNQERSTLQSTSHIRQ